MNAGNRHGGTVAPVAGDGRPDGPLDAAERWFVSRGLPHFVERRESVWVIWSRAIPLLTVFYVAVGLNALDLRRWSVLHNAAIALVVLAVLVGIAVGANVVRGQRALRFPTSIGPGELGVLIIAPVVPSLLVGQWGDAVQVLVTTGAALSVIWVMTSYGVLALAGWALRRARSQAAVLFGVVVRALPLLLLFTTFLFISAEVWQVAGRLYGPLFWIVLAVFFVLGLLFLISRVPPLLRRLNTFSSWEEVATLVDEAGLDRWPATAPSRPAGPAGAVPLLPRQRFNAGLVALFPQAIHILLAAASLTGFFVAFGVLAIPSETMATWLAIDSVPTTDVHTLATLHFGGRELVLTEPLLRVAGFLGAFTGMYFTVVLSTDATYRDEFVDDVGPALRQALAVRVLYRERLTGHDGEGVPSAHGAGPDHRPT
jgi:hypothetical protein